MVVEDLKAEDNMPVNITMGDRVVRTVMLNARRETDGVRDNDVVRLKNQARLGRGSEVSVLQRSDIQGP